MNRVVLLLTCIVSLACASGCFRSNIQRYEISVPELAGETEANDIEMALGSTTDPRSIVDVQFDMAQRKVVVSCDSRRIAQCNIEAMIAHAGYTANNLPAEPRRSPARARAPISGPAIP